MLNEGRYKKLGLSRVMSPIGNPFIPQKKFVVGLFIIGYMIETLLFKCSRSTGCKN
jgi:hypothetical protein